MEEVNETKSLVNTFPNIYFYNSHLQAVHSINFYEHLFLFFMRLSLHFFLNLIMLDSFFIISIYFCYLSMLFKHIKEIYKHQYGKFILIINMD